MTNCMPVSQTIMIDSLSGPADKLGFSFLMAAIISASVKVMFSKVLPMWVFHKLEDMV